MVGVIGYALYVAGLDPEAGKGSAYDAGWAAGQTGVITVLLCIGIPLAIGLELLAWRNRVGLRNKKQHAEMLAAVQQPRQQ